MAEVNWLSLREIAREFGLETLVDQPNALATELRKLRAESHPDRFGGKFPSDFEREKYYKLDNALNFMEAQQLDSNAVIPISQLPSLIETLSKSLVPQEAITSTGELHKQSLKDAYSSITHRYRPRKVGSGVFAGIIIFLFTQTETLAKHPLFGTLFSSRIGQISIMGLFIASVVFFAMSRLLEQKEERLIKYLMSEDALRHRSPEIEYYEGNGEISDEELRNIFGRKGHNLNFYTRIWGKFLRLDRDSVDLIVDLQIKRLIERGVLTPSKRPGIIKRYEIDFEALGNR